ncbi:MAG TPA: metallophosphoesterase family protein [Chitinophagales bacterium]|nr:metallophosphoesterase family protein [Chitinophagales bacterium]
MARYAISDIHGCCRTFEKMLFETLNLQKTDVLYLLGDYIDRGPDSKGVLDLIMRLQEEGYEVHCLLGNHEAMMLIDQKEERQNYESNWYHQGGLRTLQSFGVSHVSEIPANYIDFMENLHLTIKLDDYWLVHAGFNFRKPNFWEDMYALIWIRNWHKDIKPELLEGRMIIHGHTPMPAAAILSAAARQPLSVLDIDAGCVYAEIEGYGYLCAMNLDTRELIFEANIDEQKPYALN